MVNVYAAAGTINQPGQLTSATSTNALQRARDANRDRTRAAGAAAAASASPPPLEEAPSGLERRKSSISEIGQSVTTQI